MVVVRAFAHGGGKSVRSWCDGSLDQSFIVYLVCFFVWFFSI